MQGAPCGVVFTELDHVPAAWLLSWSLSGSSLQGAVQTQGGHGDL